jgi:autotransporter-associated beta strand protein
MNNPRTFDFKNPACAAAEVVVNGGNDYYSTVGRRHPVHLFQGLCVFVLFALFNAGISARAVTTNNVNTIFDAYTNAYYALSGTSAWFRNNQTSGNNPGNATYFWGQAEEIECVIDAYEWTSNSTYKVMITNLLNGFENNNGTNWSYDSYNDDCMWACMAFVRGYLDTGNAKFENIAKWNFDLVYARGWDTTLGGMWWNTSDTNKVAAVNGPASIAAYLLYQSLGDSTYLTKSTNIYNWEKVNLFVSGSGMIYDGENSSGVPGGAPTTYNQGTFIGAANFLGLTNDAMLAANYTMNNLAIGGILPQYGIANNNSGFNAIFIRWLARFMNTRGLQSAYESWLEANATAAWNVRRTTDNLSWCQWLESSPVDTDFYSWDCISSVEALLAAVPAQNAYWQGGTADYNAGANWAGGVVPGIGTNVINDSGSNNIVKINAGDPAWTVNGLWAGDGTNSTGAYVQSGSTVNLGNPGGWLRLGDSSGAVGYYTLNAGTLDLSNNLTAIGASGSGVLDVNGGSAILGSVVIGINSGGTGILNLNGTVLNALGITGGSGFSTVSFDGGTVQAAANNAGFINSLSAATILAGGVTFDSQSFSITASSAMGGAGSLTKIGVGWLTLTAYNTFTGPTAVNGGMLAIDGNNDVSSVLSDTASLTVNNGGTVLVMQNNSLFGYGTYVVPVRINAGGTLTISNGLTAHIKGAVYLNGGTLASSDPGLGSDGTWNLDQGTVATLGGPATSTIGAQNVLLASPTTFNIPSGATNGTDLAVSGYFSSGAVVKSGAGVMQFTGANSYSGGTTVSGGALQLGDGINSNGAVSGNITNNATLAFANPSPQTYSGVISGTGSLTKIGAGTLSLAALNIYSGVTTVSNGTLALTGFGQLSQSSLINVMAGASLNVTGRSDQTLTLKSGQTLKGSGSLTGKLNALAGSAINPGDNIGTLTVQNNITLAGWLLMELNRTNVQNCDQLVSSAGTIIGGGTLTVTNLGPALQLGDTFQLFNRSASGFATANLPNVAPYNWANDLASNGTIEVVVSSTTPPKITVQMANNILTLAWPADHTGWQLQCQTNSLTETWVNVSASSTTNQMTIPLDTDNGSVFFRLIYSP